MLEVTAGRLRRTRHLRDVTFVVTDTETTGTIADTNRLIEIAAVKVRGGRVVDRFTQLINPGIAVPRFITQLTGISTGMLFNQPAAADVMPEFVKFLEDGVLVAHNLPFDQRFINAELMRAGLPPLPNQSLCTLRLARRLLPGLHSKGLSSVADFFGIRFNGRHRALGDAEATAEVLIRFLSRVEFEYNISTLEELLTFQYRRYSRPAKEPAHLHRIRQEILPQLPERPGVYFMKDTAGRVIYVGKAKSLAYRVRSYFTGIEGHPEKVRKMIEYVRDVSWMETGSELGALLLESRLIKEMQPSFNRAQLRYRNRPFIRLDVNEAFPRISWSPFVLNDGAEYFGPVGGRKRAEMVIDLINRFYKLRECDDATFQRGGQCIYGAMGRCCCPCETADADAYRKEVDRVRAFLNGKDRALLVRLEQSMKEAAAALNFEEAAQFRDWWKRLDRVIARQSHVAAPVFEHNAVLLLPAADNDHTQLYLVRFGRLVETLLVGLPLTATDAERIERRIRHHFRPDQRRPGRYLKKEIDEVHILANWLYSNRDSARQILFEPDTDLDAYVIDVLKQAGTGVEPHVERSVSAA